MKEKMILAGLIFCGLISTICAITAMQNIIAGRGGTGDGIALGAWTIMIVDLFGGYFSDRGGF